MSQSYCSNWKLCGTCNSWSGNREASSSGKYSFVDGPMALGTCESTDSDYRNQKMQPHWSCQKYKRWTALKD